jgi:2-oxoisovalerate dehydrogenase E2 component (dihydrolipoyl transacylase)
VPRTAFRLPDVGEGIAEAELVAWHVKPGERIAEDDPLLDVMTDKATVEIPSPISGLVVSLIGAPGEKLAIGSEIAVFERDGAEAPPPAPPPPAATPPPAAPAHKVLAAPAVRERARRLGIELAGIAGTGACGRITHEDLDRQHRPAPASMPDAVVETPMIGLRRRIAERLQDAAQRIPHFTYVEEIDVGALEDLRASLNAAHPGQRLTVLPFLIRALVRVLPRFPQANAHYDEAAEVLRQHSGVHVGIATATPQGLLVPVLRHAETLDLWQSAAAIAALTEAARGGHAERETLSGSTITVTSLGLLGGIVATPIINTPEVAIVGVNRIVERPVVRGGAIVIGKVMNLSCSFDHRVLDGWEAASFVQAIKALLEQPALLFIDKGEKP